MWHERRAARLTRLRPMVRDPPPGSPPPTRRGGKPRLARGIESSPPAVPPARREETHDSRQAPDRRPGARPEPPAVPGDVPPLARRPGGVLARAVGDPRLVLPAAHHPRRRHGGGRLRLVLGGAVERLLQLRRPAL